MLKENIIVLENLIGNKYGLLTVIDKADDEITSKGYRIKKWLCKCECGKLIVTRGASLKSGHTKGCGQKHRKYEILDGQTFGKLTVIRQAEDYVLKNGKRMIQWYCQCSCGNFIITRGTSLKSGHTRSCGCAHVDGAMGIGLQDLTGQTFGRWTVLHEDGRKKEPRGRIVPMWRCRCACGEERSIRGGTLKSNNSLSCGCYKYERLKEKTSQGFGLSSLEKNVKSYLDSIDVYYETQYIYSDLKSKSGYPLSYDFLVYKNDKPYVLIECQGLQHYKPVDYFGGEKQFKIQQQNDLLKLNYAIRHDLPLLYIPYTANTYDLVIQLLKSWF